MLQLTDPMGKFFTGDDTRWHCATTNQDIAYGFLAFYRRYDGIFGLPLTGEFKLSQYANATFQVLERAIFVYNPQHDFDTSPGLGDVFLAHINNSVGQQIVAKPLLSALNQQVSDLTTQVATLQSELSKAGDTTALQAQIADLQKRLDATTQAITTVKQAVSTF